jgi:hypothetical protein
MNALWLPLVWLLLVFGFNNLTDNHRDAILGGSVVWALVLTFITETLSAADAFYRLPVMVAWITATFAAIVFFFLTGRRRPFLFSVTWQEFEDPLVRFCFAGILMIVIVVGITAVVAPPNTWDSMTYHMARVANWIQHRNVNYYQTNIIRQLYLGPWSEFTVANLGILFGSDRLANLVQYSGMLGSLIGVSSIAAKLGSGSRGQALAALFAAALPMGLLQASSTQTDYVNSFWVLCAVNWAVSLALQAESRRDFTWFLLGASVAIAFLTKATSVLFIAPFASWAFVTNIRQLKFRIWKPLVICLVMAGIVNAGQLYRNQQAFGAPLGPKEETATYANSLHTPGAIISGLLRNLAMNMNLPLESGGLSSMMTKLVRAVTDLDPSDERITFPRTHFGFSYSHHEDAAGNPLQLLLGSLAIAASIGTWKRRPFPAIFSLCLFTALLIFSGCLKWQPWITRLQLPLFVLLASIFGVCADTIRSLKLNLALAAGLFISAMPCLLLGSPRAFLGPANIFQISRIDQYFSNRSGMARPFKIAAAFIRATGCTQVGLICNGDGWEYALRALLPNTSFFQLGVPEAQNKMRSYAPLRPPAVIVVLGDASLPPDFDRYTIVYNSVGIKVLVSKVSIASDGDDLTQKLNNK